MVTELFGVSACLWLGLCFMLCCFNRKKGIPKRCNFVVDILPIKGIYLMFETLYFGFNLKFNIGRLKIQSPRLAIKPVFRASISPPSVHPTIHPRSPFAIPSLHLYIHQSIPSVLPPVGQFIRLQFYFFRSLVPFRHSQQSVS